VSAACPRRCGGEHVERNRDSAQTLFCSYANERDGRREQRIELLVESRQRLFATSDGPGETDERVAQP